MKSIDNRNRRARRLWRITSLAIVLAMLLTSFVPPMVDAAGPLSSLLPQARTAQAAGGQIQGTVFFDQNADGVRNTVVGEPGIAGIVVTAYSNGTTVVGSDTTDANGAYAITGLSAGQQVRLEFTVPPALSYLRAGFVDGNLDGSSVVFATENDENVDVGFQNPANFAADDVFLSSPNAVVGAFSHPISSQRDALFTVRSTWGGDRTLVQATGSDEYNAQGVEVAPMRAATFGEIGTAWGTAWDRNTNNLYVGAFMKLYTDFGPEGPGAIYRVPMDPLTGQPSGSPVLFVDVADYGGISVCGSHDPDGDLSVPPQADDVTSLQVSKCSLGDLDISDDGQYLYVMNLSDRKILEINLSNGALNSSWNFPVNQGDCAGGSEDVRPFALKYYNGELYAGAVCSAESTGDAADFRAYVYRVDTGTGAFTQIFNTPGSSSTLDPTPWNNVVAGNTAACTGTNEQYLLSDIEFYGNDLTLGFRDRVGDLRGRDVPGTGDCDAQPRGEIICAAYDAGSDTYTLEANSACGSRTNTDTADWDDPEGEFFYEDGAGDGFDSGPAHPNTSFGGLAQLAGREVVMSTLTPRQAFDVGQLGSGGLLWLDQETGSAQRGFTLYEIRDTEEAGAYLWKANGLGDVEVISAPSPVEIGNFVWEDADANGYQDPGENPITGIDVELYTAGGGGTCTASGTLVNTSVTNAAGLYQFTSALNTRSINAYVVEVADLDADTQSETTNGSQDEQLSGGVNGGRAWGALRFTDLQIPPGSTINGAFLQFTVNDDVGTQSDPARVRFYAHNVADAPDLEGLANNALTNMAKTAANVTWDVPAWINTSAYEIAGPAQRSPNLAAVLQAIVSKPAWSAGNAVTFVWQEQVDGLNGQRRTPNSAADTNLIISYTPPAAPGDNAVRIEPGCDYEIRIDTTQGAIGANGWSATSPDADGDTSNGWNADLRDSDVTQTGDTASVAFTVTAWGENNHTLDAGFSGAAARDYGDAPDAAAGTATGDYNTRDADNGPYHALVDPLYLGAVAPDGDDGTLNNAAATADDLSNTGVADDEDSFNLPSITTLSTAVTLNVRATNQTGSPATMACFIDFTRDGDFADAGERSEVSVPDGSNNTNFPLSFTGFAAPTPGFSYIRCRIATVDAEVDAAFGPAANGEVEDRRVNILNQPVDYGDAPDDTAGTTTGDYETTDGDNGPRHIIVPDVYLGSVPPDADDGSLQDVDALADDASDTGAADDEDGVTTLPLITENDTSIALTVAATNNSANAQRVACWIDFNRDGDFVDAGERASVAVGASTGTQNYALTFSGFAQPVPGTSYLRCRLAGGTQVQEPTGLATTGEVEDYRVEIYAADYGDAPDTAGGTATGDYNTTAADGGPFHLISSTLRLGNRLPDGDDGTLQSTLANADDTTNTGSSDDEDGIASLPIFDTADTTVNLAVRAFNDTGSPARMACWIDFNRNGVFSDAGERAQADVPAGASLQTFLLTFSPVDYVRGISYIRCRIASDPAEVDNPTGSASSGEVEDYRVALRTFDYGDAPDTVALTGVGNYETTESDNGPRHQIGTSTWLGATAPDGEDGTLQNVAADADDTTDTGKADDEDGIPVLPAITTRSTSVDLEVFARNTLVSGLDDFLACWIDFNRDGDFLDAGEGQTAIVPHGSNNTPFTLTFSGFATPTAGDTYIRCRIAAVETQVAQPTGPSYSGEVEDYVITIASPNAAIGNYVWVDENSDGFQDAGEPGIPNVTVVLYDDQGAVVGTTFTDDDGGYLFPNLEPGTYYVDVHDGTDNAPLTMLPNFSQTTTYTNVGDGPDPDTLDDDGDFGNKDHGATAIPNTDRTGYEVSIEAGEENLTADFGYNYNTTTEVTDPPLNAVAAIGDRVWIDSDGDGAQDPNEPPVSGVQVTIFHDPDGDGVYDTPYTDGGYTPTRTTDDNGLYLFDDLPPGAYVVAVTDDAGASHEILTPSKYGQTGDPDQFGQPATNPDNRTTTPVVLGPGDVFLNADFGYQPTQTTRDTELSAIGDTVWLDADADSQGPDRVVGTDNDEPYIAGVTIALIRSTNGDRVWDAGEPIIATAVTDENGYYFFPDLPITDGAGTDDYIVWVSDTDNVLAELAPTYDLGGGSAPSGSGAPIGMDDRDVLGLSARPNLSEINRVNHDFGYTPRGNVPGQGYIGDFVWLDSNNSGTSTPDAGEAGIEGVVMELLDGNGAVIATTVTNENGYYLFGNLTVDDDGETYQVRVAASNFGPDAVLEDMYNTYDPNGGNDSLGPQVTLTTANPGNLDQDFSYIDSGDGTATPAEIGNLVWLDQNADGAWDTEDGPDNSLNTDDDEGPIGDVTIDLYRDLDSNGRVDPGEPRISTTTTASAIDNGLYGTNGVYLFTGLPQGDYIVDVTDRNGVLFGYWHSLGTPDTNQQSQLDPDPATVLFGGSNLRSDFGYYVEPACVGNYVWTDTNGNGIQDTGELGIDGVEVTMVIEYPNGTTTTLKTVTGDNPDTGAVEAGWYGFCNLLQDENYATSTTGTPTANQPVLTISVPTGGGYNPTIVEAGADDMADSNDHTGTDALTTQGLINVDQNANPSDETDPIAGYDFGYTTTPLAVALSYAYGERTSDGTVYFLWETATETGNAGFKLYMALDAGAEALVTPDMIPSTVIDSVTPVRYRYAATAAGNGYFIEMINVDGSSQRHGPYSLGVEYGEPSAVNPDELVNPLYLPLINGR